MKLTKIHIFLILLLALVLCSTLGMCYGQEGFSNGSEDMRNYKNYSDYNKAKWQSDKDTKDSKYNKDSKDSKDNKDNKCNTDNDGDLNSGNPNDRANMNTSKTKYSKYNTDDNSNVDKLSVFDSVAKGKMNGSMYNVKETTMNQDDSKGIPRNRIPQGQEDLYILKSQIVPPICPACPSVNCNSSSSGIDVKKCPPCPPCARCPEPAFECKKVPNYNSRGLMNQLPIPWASKM